MKLEQPVWARNLPFGVVLGVATLGPVGRRLPAPGTWGAAAGVVYFLLFFPECGALGTIALNVLGVYLAVAICGEAERHIGRQDPGEVILDEVVAMPLCFLGWPALHAALPAWIALLLGFGLFRLFDVTKPRGISRLQDLPGGWGIVMDDVAAALAACVVLHAVAWGWMMVR